MRTLFIILSLACGPFLAFANSNSSPDTSAQKSTSPQPSLTPEQHTFFDELIQQEQRESPEVVEWEIAAPAEAAALVEELEMESTPPDEDTTSDESPMSPITGTFIQLSRESAERTIEDWRQDFILAKEAGLDRVIIQWTAESEISYFEPAPEFYIETYPTINRLFTAANEEGIKVILGLSHDPRYWQWVPARNDILDVYFRIRATRNLFVQEALLENFDHHSSWIGYYLAEEIDDLNWRNPLRESLFHQFLLRSGRIIRERDDQRPVSISAFFRKRTAPSTFAENLWNLLQRTGIDQIWVQDGIGVELLSTALIDPYYQELNRRFTEPPPTKGIIVELFEQTSGSEEPFAAQPALPLRVERQLRDASTATSAIILFSLFDYADPRKGESESKLYDLIRDWNSQIQR